MRAHVASIAGTLQIRLFINSVFGKFRQALVSSLFLFECLAQKIGGVPVTWMAGMRPWRPAACNLIMLHALTSTDQGCLTGFLAAIGLQDFCSLANQAFHTSALLAFGCNVQFLAHLLNALGSSPLETLVILGRAFMV